MRGRGRCSRPATGFGQYTWGRTGGRAVQPLRAHLGGAQRDPAGPAQDIRLLDAVESRFASGRAAPGPGVVLPAAASIRCRAQRPGLARGPAPPARSWCTSRSSALGMGRVALFGPGVAADRSAGRQVSDRGADPLYPAIEVFAVPGYEGPVRAVSSDSEVRITGGPEAVLQAMEAGSAASPRCSTATRVPDRPRRWWSPTACDAASATWVRSSTTAPRR